MSHDDAGLAGHLFSEGPHRAKEDKLQLFGQFVGDWDIVEDRFPQKDGSELRFRGELHWAWILDGLATQDVWMQYDESQKRNVPVGTTIRFHDEGIDAWRSIWIAPGGSIIRTFIGRKDGDDIVLEGNTEDGRPEQWIFFDISRDEFKWKALESKDGGRNWELTEEMLIRRKGSLH